MATYEYNGLMTVKDAAGNKYLLYPITKAECVDGLEEALAAKAAATHHHAAGDVNSGIFDSARIPNLDASKPACPLWLSIREEPARRVGRPTA